MTVLYLNLCYEEAIYKGLHYIYTLVCLLTLTLKAPITTAADEKVCDIFPNFQMK